jgi:hypothetical protein
MRKYLGWFALVVPLAASLVVEEVEWRYLTIGSNRSLLFYALIVTWLGGVAALAFTPFRSPILKWTLVPLYVVLMPAAMIAISVLIRGIDFGS